MNNNTRRTFLRYSALSAVALAAPSFVKADSYLPDSVKQVNKTFGGDKGAVLDPALVQEFVRLSHFNFDGVTTMIAEQPQLVYASWDWGGGDFETGLGAASHVGNRRIAEFLIASGARPDIFAMTMLGHTSAVKSLLEINPSLKDCKGPHQLSLIHHAQKGGEQAKELLAYLENHQ